MLRNLQIWHLLCLALIPILFALFRLSSESHDADRALVENLIVVGGSVWIAFAIVSFVITGKKEETLPNLVRLYRGLLEKMWFLWIANVAGTALVIVIAYHLACFRQVEFLGTTDVELILNDRVDKQTLIGIVPAKKPSTFRLRIGSRKLVFREVGSDKILGGMELVVPSLIEHPAKVRAIIRYRRGVKYEQTG